MYRRLILKICWRLYDAPLDSFVAQTARDPRTKHGIINAKSHMLQLSLIVHAWDRRSRVSHTACLIDKMAWLRKEVW